MQGLSREQRLIAEFFAPLAEGVRGAFGLIDDAALISPEPGEEIVITTDTVVEGVHFLSENSPGDVAAKALRVNLSDLAAKGAEPRGYLLSLALAPHWGDDHLAAFVAALAEDQATYGCLLYGGDTVATPGPATITITAFGTLPESTMVHRAGAGAGDHLYVSGTIGDSTLGLSLMSGDPPWKLALSGPMIEQLEARYRLPQPRKALAPAVRAHASAALDVSDGLAGDLGLLCRASELTARVDVATVPLSAPARAAIDRAPDLLAQALTGGDDYEILCTVPPDRCAAFEEAAKQASVDVTLIGTVSDGSRAPELIGHDGKPLKLGQRSYSHL